MPTVISRRRAPPQIVEVPPRVGLALRPELLRDVIPARVTLDGKAPPYAGELREEQAGPLIAVIAPNGGQAVGATLRRAWTFVGYAIDPGDTGALAGVTAALAVLVRGIGPAIIPGSIMTLTGKPQALGAIIVGARAEVIIFNGSTGPGTPIHNVRATIWGMSER